jgi:hypothetical protein
MGSAAVPDCAIWLHNFVAGFLLVAIFFVMKLKRGAAVAEMIVAAGHLHRQQQCQ